jgi:hypothetical protein
MFGQRQSVASDYAVRHCERSYACHADLSELPVQSQYSRNARSDFVTQPSFLPTDLSSRCVALKAQPFMQ